MSEYSFSCLAALQGSELQAHDESCLTSISAIFLIIPLIRRFTKTSFLEINKSEINSSHAHDKQIADRFSCFGDDTVQSVAVGRESVCRLSRPTAAEALARSLRGIMFWM